MKSLSVHLDPVYPSFCLCRSLHSLVFEILTSPSRSAYVSNDRTLSLSPCLRSCGARYAKQRGLFIRKCLRRFAICTNQLLLPHPLHMCVLLAWPYTMVITHIVMKILPSIPILTYILQASQRKWRVQQESVFRSNCLRHTQLLTYVRCDASYSISRLKLCKYGRSRILSTFRHLPQ